jgi:uncharacterized protein (DUF2235 family)
MSDSDTKNIILLLDGTRNDADSGEADTNIVRLGDVSARRWNRLA